MHTKLKRTFQREFIFKSFWWLLWLSAIVLLECYFRSQAGERIKIPFGQYWFFAIAVFSIAGLWFAYRETLSGKFNSNRFFFFSLCILLLTLGLSAVFGINSAYGLRLLVILMITSIPFMLLGMLAYSVPYQSRITPLLVVSACCAVGAALLSLTGPISWFGYTLENYLMGQRWAFLFIEANGLGGMMALAVTCIFYQIHVIRTKTFKWILFLFVLPVIVLVFWKTNSRGSLLWILVTLIFYCGLWCRNLVHQFTSLQTRQFFLPGLGIVIGFAVLLAIIYRYEISAFLRLDQRDLTTGRMEIWLFYLEQVKNNPLLGFGFGASDQLMSGYEVKGPFSIAGPLNVFVGILGEAGVLGFSAMLWLWFGAILRAWQIVRNRIDSQDGLFHYAFFLMVVLISLVAHQNGEWQILRITPFNFLFFFLLASAWTLPKPAEIPFGKTQAFSS
jgi:O-antigen ligase